MEDHPRTPKADFYKVLGISKNATIKDMCRAYKSLVKKWHPDRNPSNKVEAEAKFQEINEAYKALNDEKTQRKTRNSDEPASIASKNTEGSLFSKPSNLLHSLSRKSYKSTSSPTRIKKSASQRSHSPTPTLLARSTSHGTSNSPNQKTTNSDNEMPFLSQRSSCSSPTPAFLPRSTSYGTTTSTWTRNSNQKSTPSHNEVPCISKTTNHRSSTPIVFSQSIARRKPPPVETRLECKLEELLHGCVKQIVITRDVINDGIIEREEEKLLINIKPGWKSGTKITFEGKGEERPGYYPADVIFIIGEQKHSLFRRLGDDLEHEVEIPLVKALTGCTVTIPLLGGGQMCLTFDDIINPSYEKVIRGQGMPNSKQDGKRGKLKIKFIIKFPSELSDQQRYEAFTILKDSF
ncbi:hypothetical protein K2173_022231 [Erythroxylum novogranatense]|uniref:J domain-containing protein n=1 Tax=Erythroxylum novogranatense TaxID=1862640 RepID=A0AAV8STM9_9ROSI|nr:hypothetical protein K2173_022231 [Erythroxylum novogranatense]